MLLSLIGYRGSGKSAVAKLLALALRWDWVDSDVEIELAAGKSIASIFADEGEEHFRDLESAAISSLYARDRTVIALGGGAVLREQNRQIISTSGKVAWLMASPETLLERIQSDPASAARRPDLTRQGGLNEIIDILGRREKIYRECADWQVDTEGKTPAEVAGEIRALHEACGP